MSSPRRRRRSRATRGRRTTSARSAASRSSTGSRRSTWPVAPARWGASLGVLEPLLLRGRERYERAAGGDPWECWQLDTTGWIDLPNSCFAYSDAGRALFGTRTIATPMQPDLYSPRPGQRRVFERRKVARLERRDGRLALFHSMHDNAHGFEMTYEIALASGTIVRAEHGTPRLPYMGLCSEPQRRIAAMLGETVDAGLRKRIQAHLGGAAGCAQLYDLTADLLKLLA